MHNYASLCHRLAVELGSRNEVVRLRTLQHPAMRLFQRRQLLAPTILQETEGSLMPVGGLAQYSATQPQENHNRGAFSEHIIGIYIGR